MRTPIIPIFIPHQGCPHQCVFCNQTKITGCTTTVTAEDIRKELDLALAYNTKNLPEVAYYGGSFTALPMEVQQELLQPAYELLRQGRIESIRISTRPDYINHDILIHLQSFGVKTVELGAQSLEDSVLAKANRGHTYKDIQAAVHQLREASFVCGLQLMVGLPGEDWSGLICSAQRAAALRPDFVRIYPTLVIADTPLAEEWSKQNYAPLTLAEAVRRCVYLKIFFEHHHQLPVIRTGLQASDFLEQPGTILAGPYHPSFGEMVDAHIFYLLITHVLEGITTTRLILIHHPKDHSKVRGLHSTNITRLRAEHSIAHVELVPQGKTVGEIQIIADKANYVINPKMLFCI